MVFDEVQSDLEIAGYEVLPFILPACGVNAPHRRDRIWFIAHACNRGYGSNNRSCEDKQETDEVDDEGFTSDTPCICERKPADDANTLTESRETRVESCGACGGRIIADTNIEQRSEGRMHKEGPEASTGYTGACNTRGYRQPWENFPTQSPVCGGNDGISDRVHRLKALGNAVVPQVVYQIFKAIQQYELLTNARPA